MDWLAVTWDDVALLHVPWVSLSRKTQACSPGHGRGAVANGSTHALPMPLFVITSAHIPLAGGSSCSSVRGATRRRAWTQGRGSLWASLPTLAMLRGACKALAAGTRVLQAVLGLFPGTMDSISQRRESPATCQLEPDSSKNQIQKSGLQQKDLHQEREKQTRNNAKATPGSLRLPAAWVIAPTCHL